MRAERTAAIAAAALSLGLAAPAGAATTNVTVDDGEFAPDQIQITAGDTVKWTWADGGHNVKSTSGPEAFELDYGEQGDTGQRVFSKPGVYTYVCEPHDDEMRGRITVVEASSSPPPPSSSPKPPPSGGGSTPPPSGGSGSPAPGSGSAPAPSGDFGAPSLGTIDSAAPALSSVRARNGALRLRSTEAGRLVVRAVRVGARGHRVRTRRYTLRAGANVVSLRRWLRRGRYRVAVQAVDAGGNVSAPARLRLSLR
jgi:plastocyanin